MIGIQLGAMMEAVYHSLIIRLGRLNIFHTTVCT